MSGKTAAYLPRQLCWGHSLCRDHLLRNDTQGQARSSDDRVLLSLRMNTGELAKKESVSQRSMSYRLCFGRFLNFGTTVLNA
jgi:hypothetical protein